MKMATKSKKAAAKKTSSRAPRLLYPKWKYRVDEDGNFQSTLVGNATAEEEIGKSWTDDPHEHGVDVVPYPAELTAGGSVVHHGTRADANGNFAHGPAPTATGYNGVTVGRV